MLTRPPALLLLLVVSAASNALAQTRDRKPSSRAAAASDAATIADGWGALAGGRAAVAVRAADRVLARRPWDHAAVVLKIIAGSATDPIQGLNTYEQWMRRSSSEDVGLLEPVAVEVLRQIAANADRDLRREAQRMLTRAGLPAAPAAASDGEPSFEEDSARARAGNADALKRLEAAAAAPTMPDQSELALALEHLGMAGVPGLLTILKNSAGPNRAAAAAALGRLKAHETVPVLRESMRDSDPLVRSSAAVALARLGTPDGQAFVQKMLESEVPDVRLMAAEAWDGQNGPWVAAVMPLLQNRDGLTRLHAARLIAPVDPEAARRTLQEASIDPNPVIRATALKEIVAVAAQPGVADIAQLRRALRETDPAIRLQAAGAILESARGGKSR